jgi:hypothetical protein
MNERRRKPALTHLTAGDSLIFRLPEADAPIGPTLMKEREQ